MTHDVSAARRFEVPAEAYQAANEAVTSRPGRVTELSVVHSGPFSAAAELRALADEWAEIPGRQECASELRVRAAAIELQEHESAAWWYERNAERYGGDSRADRPLKLASRHRAEAERVRAAELDPQGGAS